MKLFFAKMHSLSNDFMIVDLTVHPMLEEVVRKHVRSWSDRRTGVGFDQLLVVLPTDHANADFRCLVLNADGTEAEQCGNGIRCAARYMERFARGIGTERELIFLVGESLSRVLLIDDIMTSAELCVPFVTTNHSLRMGWSVNVVPVNVGNPHAVIFSDNVTIADVNGIGEEMQKLAEFPHQVNVGFLQVVNETHGYLRVYERGVGETSACGSAAAAAMVAAQVAGFWGKKACIEFRNNCKLTVRWNGHGTPVEIEGSTQLVHTGGWIQIDDTSPA